MKKGLTEIVFILDKSGSMMSIKQDAIGGFNSFLEEQKKVEGEAKLTLVLFGSEVETVYQNVDINEVKELDGKTYVPSGLTALLDAIGLSIDSFVKRISELPEDEKPENVVFAIMTDGMENASREYQRSTIKNKIESVTKEKDYQFIFLGANIDAVDTAQGLGIKGMYAGQFVADGMGTKSAMLHSSEMVMSYRTTGQMASYVDVAKKTAESATDIANSLKRIIISVEDKK